ncbi:MAG: hypothetical protein NTU80_01450 [Verrucomicrobia bacterium]|nr:hypothetical protein [Verrucomicrobiota bacterium]
MPAKRSYPRTQNTLLTALFGGDLFFCYCGLTLGYLLRFNSAAPAV